MNGNNEPVRFGKIEFQFEAQCLGVGGDKGKAQAAVVVAGAGGVFSPKRLQDVRQVLAGDVVARVVDR